MLAISSIMKRRRRNIDSLTRIIYSVKNLTFLISTNFFITVSESSFRNHDLFSEKHSDANHSITDFASNLISFHFTLNFISDFKFENDFFAISSTTNSNFNIIERRKSIQSNVRNEKLNLYTCFSMRRTFLSIQNIDNLHHFFSTSSFVQLTSKISSFYNLINKVLHN